MNASSCVDDRRRADRADPAWAPVAALPEAHLAPVLTYDEQLPMNLTTRWAAANSDQVLLKDFARTLVNAVGSLLIVMGGFVLLTGVGDLRAGVVAGLLGVFAVLAGSRSNRAASRRPDRFTAGEIDAVLAHQRWVRFDDWNELAGDQTPGEVLAARRAAVLAYTLLANPAWTSAVFDTQRVRLHPVQEAQRIQLAAREVFDERVAIQNAAPLVEVDPRSELAGIRAQWAEQLRASFSALTDRLEAFAQYTDEVLALAALLEQAQTAQRLTLRVLAKEPGLATRTAEHELAAADLHQLRAELSDLRQKKQAAAGPRIAARP